MIRPTISSGFLPLVLLTATMSLAACDRGDTQCEPSEDESSTELPGEFPGEFTYNLSDPMSYFSASFSEADGKFLEACGHAGGRLEYFDHHLEGAEGEPLRAVVCQQDAAVGGKVILTISGIHGIEGFAGSAAQIGLLMNGETLPLPAGYRAVHVHMLNPYGASWVLKENEDNVDVLKNSNRLWEQGISDSLLVEFVDRLETWNLGTPAGQEAALAVFPEMIGEYGPEAFGAALVTGQGQRPFGIAYWGSGRSWSVKVLEQIAETYLAEASELVVIDWHTAFGEYGTWNVLAADAESQALLEGWLSSTLVIANNVPSGETPFFEFLRPTPETKLVRAIIEAGTYPSEPYQAYFILNLYCRFFAGGWDSPTCAVTRTEIGEFFYPKGEDWRVALWDNFGPMWLELSAGLEAGI